MEMNSADIQRSFQDTSRYNLETGHRVGVCGKEGYMEHEQKDEVIPERLRAPERGACINR